MWQNNVKALNGGEGALIWKIIAIMYKIVVGITVREIYRSHPKPCPQHLLHSSV